MAGWRKARRVIRLGFVVALQAAVFAGATAGGAGLIINTGYIAFQNHRANPLVVLLLRPSELSPDEVGPLLGAMTGSMVLLGLLSGVWIRSALAHLPPVRTWFVWTAIVVLIAVSPALLYRLSQAVQPGSRLWGDPESSMRLTHTLTAAAMFAGAVTLGFPIGRSVRATWRANLKSRRSKFRRARRRLREDR